jgi:tetratricopeptide (TPR) repeat protein
MTLQAGTRVGSYQILATLGAGGMGEVYRAHDANLARDVAIKFLPRDDETSRYGVERFLREARAASALNHPNIVTIFDAGEVDIGYFIVMELVRGRTLRSFIGIQPDIGLIGDLATQIAKALAAVHEIGVTHRDIKPENIMVRDDGYVKVLDFGLARSAVPRPADAPEPGAVTTVSQGVLGTLRYMSPEQGSGLKLDQATDIFSLGLVLYELATGQHPFEADTSYGVLHSIISDTPLPPLRFNPGLPSAIAGLLIRMLDKDPRCRPSAIEVVAEFNDVLHRASSSVRTDQQVRSSRTVGRERERADLSRALDEAASGHGLMVCVVGEPGIGKSTLVEELLANRQQGGLRCRIARGRCSERLAGTEAYLPMLDALENLLGSGGSGGSALARTLRAVAPLWHSQLAGSSTEALPSGHLVGDVRTGSQERLKREFVAFLQEATRDQPLILFLDDVHWADVSTIDLLSYVVSRFQTMPLFVVVAYRPEELLSQGGPFLRIKHDLQARGYCRELELEFLTPEDVEAYVGLEFAGHLFPRSFIELIHEKTEGNPLFMVDLLRFLRDRQVLSTQDGRWRLGRELPDIARTLPESIRSMILRKIESVDATARRILLAASVQGNEFDGAVVARALAMDPAEVEERLQLLDRIYTFARPVREVELPDGTLTLKYRFVHVLYQNLLYAALTPARKVAMSKAVAHVLEEVYRTEISGIASELAVLYEVAREFGRAADYFVSAAQHAAHVFAYQEVSILAKRGLVGLEAMPRNDERSRKELALLLSLAVSLSATKGFGHPDVEDVLTRAHGLCAELNETTELFRVVWGLCRHYTIVLRLEDARSTAGRLFELAGVSGDPELLIQAHFVAGCVCYLCGEFAETVDHFEQVKTLYDPSAHRRYVTAYTFDPRAAAGAWNCCAYWFLGYPERAREEIETTLALARRLQHSYTLALTLFFAAVVYQLRRDWDKAEAYTQELLVVSSHKELAHLNAATGFFFGLVVAVQGDRSEGVRRMQEALVVYQATGARTSRARVCCQLAEQLGFIGDVESASTIVEREIETAGLARYFLAELYRVKGELLWKQMNLAAAEEALERAMAIAHEQRAKSVELRAAAAMYRMRRQHGDAAAARERLEHIYASFTEGLDSADLKDAKALLDER